MTLNFSILSHVCEMTDQLKYPPGMKRSRGGSQSDKSLVFLKGQNIACSVGRSCVESAFFPEHQTPTGV